MSRELNDEHEKVGIIQPSSSNEPFISLLWKPQYFLQGSIRKLIQDLCPGFSITVYSRLVSNLDTRAGLIIDFFRQRGARFLLIPGLWSTSLNNPYCIFRCSRNRCITGCGWLGVHFAILQVRFLDRRGSLGLCTSPDPVAS